MTLRILGSGIPELLVGKSVAFDVLLENPDWVWIGAPVPI